MRNLALKKRERSLQSTHIRSIRTSSRKTLSIWISMETTMTRMKMMRAMLIVMISIKKMFSISRMLSECRCSLNLLRDKDSAETVSLVVDGVSQLQPNLKLLYLLQTLVGLYSLNKTKKEFPCSSCLSEVVNKVSHILCLTMAMTLCSQCKTLWMRRNSCLFLHSCPRILMIMLSNQRTLKDKISSIYCPRMQALAPLSISSAFMTL